MDGNVLEDPRQNLDVLRRAQRRIASAVVETRLESCLEIVGAVDLHLSGRTGIAVALSMTVPELEIVEAKSITGEVDFPYMPGFLAFREAPLCLEAIGLLERRPDLLLVDGHGRAHPRRCGIGCHIGVELGMPTIGVAKSRLVGRHAEPTAEKGACTDLIHGDDLIGKVVRTRGGVRPVFISVGNMITLDEAVDWTLSFARRYRLPEPSHLAHKIARELARELRQSG